MQRETGTFLTNVFNRSFFGLLSLACWFVSGCFKTFLELSVQWICVFACVNRLQCSVGKLFVNGSVDSVEVFGRSHCSWNRCAMFIFTTCSQSQADIQLWCLLKFTWICIWGNPVVGGDQSHVEKQAVNKGGNETHVKCKMLQLVFPKH